MTGPLGCALCGLGIRVGLTRVMWTWSCPCGARHYVCEACLDRWALLGSDGRRAVLRLCPESDEFAVAREVMGGA